jgi:hypothetical protein
VKRSLLSLACHYERTAFISLLREWFAVHKKPKPSSRIKREDGLAVPWKPTPRVSQGDAELAARRTVGETSHTVSLAPNKRAVKNFFVFHEDEVIRGMDANHRNDTVETNTLTEVTPVGVPSIGTYTMKAVLSGSATKRHAKPVPRSNERNLEVALDKALRDIIVEQYLQACREVWHGEIPPAYLRRFTRRTI